MLQIRIEHAGYVPHEDPAERGQLDLAAAHRDQPFALQLAEASANSRSHPRVEPRSTQKLHMRLLMIPRRRRSSSLSGSRARWRGGPRRRRRSTGAAGARSGRTARWHVADRGGADGHHVARRLHRVALEVAGQRPPLWPWQARRPGARSGPCRSDVAGADEGLPGGAGSRLGLAPPRAARWRPDAALLVRRLGHVREAVDGDPVGAAGPTICCSVRPSSPAVCYGRP